MSRFNFAEFDRLKQLAQGSAVATDADKFAIFQAQLSFLCLDEGRTMMHGGSTMRRVAEAVNRTEFEADFETSAKKVLDRCAQALATNYQVRSSHLLADPGDAAFDTDLVLVRPTADSAMTVEQADAANAACPLGTPDVAEMLNRLRAVVKASSPAIDDAKADRIIAALAEDATLDTANPDPLSLRVAFYRLKTMTKDQVTELYGGLSENRRGLRTLDAPPLALAPAPAGTVVQWSKKQLFTDAELATLTEDSSRNPDVRAAQLGRFIQICVLRLSLPPEDRQKVEEAIWTYFRQRGTDVYGTERLQALQNIESPSSLLAELVAASKTNGHFSAAVAQAEVRHLVNTALREIRGLPETDLDRTPPETSIHNRLRKLQIDLTALKARHPDTASCVDAALERLTATGPGPQLLSQSVTRHISTRGGYIGQTRAIHGLTEERAQQGLRLVLEAAREPVKRADAAATKERSANKWDRVESELVESGERGLSTAAADRELRKHAPLSADQCGFLRSILLDNAVVSGGSTGLGAVEPPRYKQWRLDPNCVAITPEGSPLSLSHTVTGYDVPQSGELDDGNGGHFRIDPLAGATSLQAYYRYAKDAIDAQEHLSAQQKNQYLITAMRSALTAMLAVDANAGLLAEMKRQFEKDGRIPIFLPHSTADADQQAAKLWYQACCQHILGQVKAGLWKPTQFNNNSKGPATSLAKQLSARLGSAFAEQNRQAQLFASRGGDPHDMRLRVTSGQETTTLNIRHPRPGHSGGVYSQGEGLTAQQADDIVRAAQAMGLEKPPIRANNEADFRALLSAGKKLGYELSMDQGDPLFARQQEWLAKWQDEQPRFSWSGSPLPDYTVTEAHISSEFSGGGDVSRLLSEGNEALEAIRSIAAVFDKALGDAERNFIAADGEEAAAAAAYRQPKTFAEFMVLEGEARDAVIAHIVTHARHAELNSPEVIDRILENYTSHYDHLSACNQLLQRAYGAETPPAAGPERTATTPFAASRMLLAQVAEMRDPDAGVVLAIAGGA